MREMPSLHLQPPTLPSKRYILERLGHLELDPKSILPGVGGGSRRHLSNEPKDESVETKWEHLQYYESRLEDPQMSLETPTGGGENSYSSMASCSTGSSTTSANSNSSSVSSRLSAKSVKEGWKKFKSHIFSRNRRSLNGNSGGNNDNGMNGGATSYNDFEGVSTAPMPPNNAGTTRTGALSKIRSSKSLQNLEAITSSVTSNLKEKYHSRLELRHSKPSSHYEELWDDDDPDERMQRMMASVGLG